MFMSIGVNKEQKTINFKLPTVSTPSAFSSQCLISSTRLPDWNFALKNKFNIKQFGHSLFAGNTTCRELHIIRIIAR